MTPLLLATAWAAGRPPEVVQPTVEPDAGLDALGIVQVRGSSGNVIPTNAFFDGQVLGDLGGTNGTVVSDEERATTVEQRAQLMLGWRPLVSDGKAGLNAAFEVDYTWGDQAWSIGPNTGGGFGGRQVNLQSRRLFADFEAGPTHTLVGLQFLGDSVSDPTRLGSLDQVARSGGRCLFFCSEAAGAAVYGQGEAWRSRVGFYQLGEGVVGEKDDISLIMADGEWRPAYAWRLGAHVWHLRDRALGQGGALGTGVTSALSQMQGAPFLELGATNADLTWVGVDLAYNPGLNLNRVGGSAVVVASVGRLYVSERADIPVQGVLADAELRYQWGQGSGSILRVEGLITTADDDDSSRYTGVITGNSYGIAGAQNLTHGTTLLFADPGAINRQVAQVYDVSGAGRGVGAITASAGYDPIPDRLTTTATVGFASVGGIPARELNFRVEGRPMTLLELGATGAWLALPGTDATMVLLTLDWLVTP